MDHQPVHLTASAGNAAGDHRRLPTIAEQNELLGNGEGASHKNSINLLPLIMMIIISINGVVRIDCAGSLPHVY